MDEVSRDITERNRLALVTGLQVEQGTAKKKRREKQASSPPQLTHTRGSLHCNLSADEQAQPPVIRKRLTCEAYNEIALSRMARIKIGLIPVMAAK
jgi:hypothetical protein